VPESTPVRVLTPGQSLQSRSTSHIKPEAIDGILEDARLVLSFKLTDPPALGLVLI
jgi:hypothetical protein